MDAQSDRHGGWVVEIVPRLPYNFVVATEDGQHALERVFAIFLPMDSEPSAVRAMSELSVSVRFLPGRTVQGEVVDDRGLPANGQLKAIPGAVVGEGEGLGG